MCNFLNGIPASLAPSAASPALAVSPKATIFVALPRAAWAPCGVCICSHCKGRVGYWDTLAVSTRDGTTWTVHRPEANPHHDEVDGRRWTAPATVVLAAQARAGRFGGRSLAYDRMRSLPRGRTRARLHHVPRYRPSARRGRRRREALAHYVTRLPLPVAPL